ncbi:family 43 glycosylhydrolase [Sphingobium sp. CR2-8]|uniref:family 43 glycosylhydrolase n=1 Tax=Sphingobium sp. CR2-8 TaxID=1306534 RepID=UPI002DB6A99A|nr:family 43 glycosylhydrolase [Sphingobium sp. CR2-8]MEC3910627.1 family 43 glycosylhydrolase [Sphingobium sp. CR2-8]
MLARIVPLSLLALATMAVAQDGGAFKPGARNPLIPGTFADPSIVHYKGEWFVFATMDPWGGETLGLWRSRNFRDWTFSTPNWPTKTAATSPTSNKSRVWAPSVVRGRDGRFWMYVSVGSEVWVGVADDPGGPWRDANGGKPLIPGNAKPGYHMIDAEAFVDDDGQAYLYWGSGLNWVNGRCFVVKLKPDMVTFDGEPKDVTPAHYFEAPFMVKRGGHYFLTYSWGNTTKDTYQVRYAVGTSPMGPFMEPDDRALLETDAAKQIISPGHHAVFRAGGKDFILYHRQALPFPSADGQVLRQIAVDRLIVQGDRLKAVVPTHEGPDVPGAAKRRGKALPYALAASTGKADLAGDDNYATGWTSAAGASWLQADAGRSRMIGRSQIRLADPNKAIRYRLSVSGDGQAWYPVGGMKEAKGSPIILPAAGRGRYARLDFDQPVSILEWSFLP